MSASIRGSELILMAIAAAVLALWVSHFYRDVPQSEADMPPALPGVAQLRGIELALLQVEGVARAIQYPQDGSTTVLVIVENIDELAQSERDVLLNRIREVVAGDDTVGQALVVSTSGGTIVESIDRFDRSTSEPAVSAVTPPAGTENSP